MIPTIKEVWKWLCRTVGTIFDAVQCRKFGTEYQRSMKSAQTHHFMACFQFKHVEIFKTLHFGPMHNLSKCRSETHHLNAPAAKKLKYQTKFNSAWISEFKWCASSSKGSEFAHCNSCRSDFRVCYGGRNDLKKHMETINHQKNFNSVSSTPTVSSIYI